MKWTAQPRETELSKILDVLNEEGNRQQLDQDLAAKLALTVEELFLNTVKHGASAALVTLRLEVTPDSVTLVYEDLGLPHNPFLNIDRSVLDESGDERRVGGLGVLMLEGLATSTRYQRDNDINRIELTFARAPVR